MTDPIGLTPHIEGFFGTRADAGVWDEDFLRRKGLEITALHVPPTEEFDFETYISAGMSRLSPPGAGLHDYIIASPFATEEHRELITMMASLMQSRGRAWHLGEVIDIGRPWIHGGTPDRLLVSLPYPFGPALEEADSVIPGLRLLWLLPIHAAEEAFLHAHGLEMLEDRFEEESIDFLDPARPCVV
jgi:hypothetical protein